MESTEPNDHPLPLHEQDNDDGNEISHSSQQQEEHPPNSPLHCRPPLSHPSKESLQRNIARWEALLSCSQCGVLQPSLDKLWEHPDFERPVCSRCCRREIPLVDPSSCTQPPRPLSELLRLGQSSRRLQGQKSEGQPPVSREESVRGPAILLEQMKLLLELIEQKEESNITGDENSDQKFTTAADQQRETTAEKPTTRPPLPQRQYASLDPNFLGATLNTTRQQEHEKNSQGFRYRQFGGEVYDPKLNRRNKRGNIHQEEKKEETDGELDFPESQSQSVLQWQSQSTMDPSQPKAASSQLSSQQEKDAGDSQGHSAMPEQNQPETSIPAPKGPLSTLDREEPVDATTPAKDTTGPSSSTPPNNNASDNITPKLRNAMGHAAASVFLENTSSAKVAAAADTAFHPHTSLDGNLEDTQTSLKSIATQDLPQTADFETFAPAKAQDSTLLHVHGHSGGVDSQAFQNPIASQDLPQTCEFDRWNASATATSTNDNQQSNSRVNTDSQQPQQSISTQDLPQTCEFETAEALPKENERSIHDGDNTGTLGDSQQQQPQSIATQDLPQTWDFERFSRGAPHRQENGSTQTEQVGVLEAREAHDEEATQQPKGDTKAQESRNVGPRAALEKRYDNDDFDSQPKSIDSQMLPQTADFEYPSLRLPTALRQQNHGEIIRGEEGNDPNSGNSPDSTEEQSNIEGKNAQRICDADNSQNVTKDPLQTSESTKTLEAEESQPSTRRITPPSVSLTDRARSRNEVLAIVVHEDLSFQDRGLLQSLQDSGMCKVMEIKDASPSLPEISDVFAQSDKKIAVFNSDVLESKQTLGPNNGESGMLTVCLQSFPYLLARAMGWKLMSSECLGALQRGATSLDEYSIWGDVQLYKAAAETHSQYAWHESSKWWKSLHLSPSESSLERRHGKEDELLANLNVIVGKLDAEKEAARATTDQDLISSFVGSGEGPFGASDAEYGTLSGDEIEFLAGAAGANILSSISGDCEDEVVVAIPDTLDDEEAFVNRLVECGTLPSLINNGAPDETPKVSFVYYSWVIDSISADVLAPLSIYSADFCTSQE